MPSSGIRPPVFPPLACAACATIRRFGSWCARRGWRRIISCCRCSSMPAATSAGRSIRCLGIFNCSVDQLDETIRAAVELRLGGVLLFGIPTAKTPREPMHERRRNRAAGDSRHQADRARIACDHRRLPLRIHRPRPLRRRERIAPAGPMSITTPRSNCSPDKPSATPGPAPTWSLPAA